MEIFFFLSLAFLLIMCFFIPFLKKNIYDDVRYIEHIDYMRPLLSKKFRIYNPLLRFQALLFSGFIVNFIVGLISFASLNNNFKFFVILFTSIFSFYIIFNIFKNLKYYIEIEDNIKKSEGRR